MADRRIYIKETTVCDQIITDWRKVIAWKYVWKGDLNWSYGEKNETNPDRN